jgi:hypothetical protein
LARDLAYRKLQIGRSSDRDLSGRVGIAPKTNHDDKTNFPLMGFHCILLE